MKSVSNINIHDVLAIDIETVRIAKTYAELPDDWKFAWIHKRKQEGAVADEETLAKDWIERSSLFPEFSKVCSVALVYLKGDKLFCKQYTSQDEVVLLETLAKDLELFQKSKPGLRLAGHASNHFDYPFLCKRYLINHLNIPSVLDESDRKSWEKSLICTNELWKSFGSNWGGGSSLQALCLALGVPVSKVDLVGDEVGEAFYRGELSRIARYCCLDTVATFNVLSRLKNGPVYLEDQFTIVNDGEILTKHAVLDKLSKEQKLSKGMEKELLKIFRELQPAERQGFKILVEAALGKKPEDLLQKERDFLFLLNE